MSENPVWRRFWHAVMPADHLKDGPKPFRLLGQAIVLFLDENGQPAALDDRCRHRTAKLSKGWVTEGRITCAYHGWQYRGNGELAVVPQYEDPTRVPKESVKTYRCQVRYGHVWVALDDPIRPLFDIPEDRDPKFRLIQQFYDRWSTSPLRLIENSFDNAHFSFVHKGTFGNIASPKPGRYSIEETEDGFYAEAVTAALNPPAAFPVSGSTQPTVDRLLRSSWHLPFARRFDMQYDSGIRHIIFTYATPIDDHHIQIAQFLYRNDTEAQCPAQLLVDWDARIFAEDKDVLQATDPNILLDVRDRGELHMVSDQPSVLMRKRLKAMLEEYPA
ncbi:aromatic ring-hydroxylating dioxygenase subunit alpha [Hydrogenophaga sp.]|uniref:aromatic ring-hydroxylating dioxygenase subunit alpha n=1 Tax=Hydrogenophaga sp. TaxID=1904254 RepID=UPI0027229765|nr:aromatic ring-hydroxylating dioxygenase subunit alpha [Hydrogenophaga sp.]MDO9434193.1 aromatic ring-hydroxylating dioxygenase subunit alpha [Hydrogenophaga sp.]